jgi:hypothetical protein
VRLGGIPEGQGESGCSGSGRPEPCAALLAQSEELDDVEIPHDQIAEEGWRSYANAAGALRTEHTLPRDTEDEAVDEPTESVLDGLDAEYLRDGATTAEDLSVLSPQVPTRVRAELENADPTLDVDVDAWFAGDCDLPLPDDVYSPDGAPATSTARLDDLWPVVRGGAMEQARRRGVTGSPKQPRAGAREAVVALWWHWSDLQGCGG